MLRESYTVGTIYGIVLQTMLKPTLLEPVNTIQHQSTELNNRRKPIYSLIGGKQILSKPLGETILSLKFCGKPDLSCLMPHS